MKKILFIVIIFTFSFCFAQEKIFSSRKGSKFFPGHLDISITLNGSTLKYELFNHWYSGAYTQLRSIEIPLENLKTFNSKNDTLEIKLDKDAILLKDKKFHINKTVGKTNLCTSLEDMRKISYAYEVSKKNNLKPFELFELSDLQFSETEFNKKVNENLSKLKSNK